MLLSGCKLHYFDTSNQKTLIKVKKGRQSTFMHDVIMCVYVISLWHTMCGWNDHECTVSAFIKQVSERNPKHQLYISILDQHSICLWVQTLVCELTYISLYVFIWWLFCIWFWTWKHSFCSALLHYQNDTNEQHVSFGLPIYFKNNWSSNWMYKENFGSTLMTRMQFLIQVTHKVTCTAGC